MRCLITECVLFTVKVIKLVGCCSRSDMMVFNISSVDMGSFGGTGKRWLVGVLVVAGVAAGLGGVRAAWAGTTYGEGPYSSCELQTVCVITPTPTPSASATPRPSVSSTPKPSAGPTVTPSPAPSTDPTIGATPTGLEFAINLSDGQVVPRPSYTVVVTPLNGLGRTFARVEFVVDDHLAATVAPDVLGTARWVWDTRALTSATVRVVVYDTDGSATPKVFRVRTAAAARESRTILDVVLSPAAAAEVKRLMKQIPVPVAQAFPYLLFGLLGAVLVVLVVQARRETASVVVLRAALARERLIVDEKMTFLQLVAHYLRTPLTLIQAGIDGLGDAARTWAGSQALGVAVAALGLTVDGLLKEMDDNRLLHEVPSAETVAQGEIAVWRSVGFWLPIGLLAGVTVIFNYLIIGVGELDVGAIDLLCQAVVLVFLGLGLYYLLRGRRLRRAERTAGTSVLEHQAAVDGVRVDFIARAAQKLLPDVNRLGAALGGLPGDARAATIARDGYRRYERLVACLSVVGQLRAGQSRAAFEPTSLTSLMQQVSPAISEALTKKGVRLVTGAEVALASQQPHWLGYVLGSVIDNAIAYSKPGGVVEVTATGGDDGSIVVTDHGQGVAPDKLKVLFQPFFKAEGALTFDHEGAGLSLYIDRLVMHYLGGEIEMKSAVGRGSVVRLTFPSR